MSTPTVTLNSGYKMPIVGLGTWQSPVEEVKGAVRVALDAGYRHIDTAAAYANEEAIGEVLQEYFKARKLRREDVFITTKLWVTFHDRVLLGLNQSLKRLNLDYVDLYLIHTPTAFRETGKGSFFPEDENGKPAYNNIKVEDTWKEMEQCVKEGKAKSIGVSNFNVSQMERICKIATIKPCTNQVECHLYLQHSKMSKFLKENGMVLTAYSPFGSPGRPALLKKEGMTEVLDDPVAKEMATKYKKSVGQILLRFLIQKDKVVIPKSTNPKRIQENLKVFDFKLADADVAKLEKQDKKLRLLKMEIFQNHPENPDAEPL